MTVGDLTIDFAQRQVAIHGRAVELTPTEFHILRYLAQNIGRIVTPDLLLEHVWGEAYVSAYHLLIVYINRVRRKVEPDPTHPRHIITRKGIGYLMPSHPAPALGLSSKAAPPRTVRPSPRQSAAGVTVDLDLAQPY